MLWTLVRSDSGADSPEGKCFRRAKSSIHLVDRSHSQKGDAIMTTKVKSSDLGCGLPYRLTYSGQVFASSETRSLVTEYIRAYKASVEHVVRYFSEVIGRGGGDELAAYILIGPSNVPQHIADTEVWREVMGKESDYVTLKKGET